MSVELAGRELTLKRIKEKCNKDWRYVIIKGGKQAYSAALRMDGGTVIVDSGEGGTALQLVGIDSIEFTDRRDRSTME
jgi:hypothetical protein